MYALRGCTHEMWAHDNTNVAGGEQARASSILEHATISSQKPQYTVSFTLYMWSYERDEEKNCLQNFRRNLFYFVASNIFSV